MQVIVMANHLFADMYAGDKRVTIRRGLRDYTLGPVRFDPATFDRMLGAQGEIVSLKVTTIRYLSVEECGLYGYKDRMHVWEVLSEYYENLTLDEPITIVEFELNG